MAIDFMVYVVLQGLRIVTDRFLPATLLDPQSCWYRTRPWERKGAFYADRLHITKWKDKLPSVDGLNPVSKTHLGSSDTEHLEALIIETCRGESHHVRSILETAVFRLWNPPGLSALIFVLSALGHAPFIMIQRYNRPRLQRHLEIEKLRAGRAHQREADRHSDGTVRTTPQQQGDSQ